MSPNLLRNSTVHLTAKEYRSMRRRLTGLGFISLRESTRGGDLKRALPPEFPGLGYDAMTKSEGNSTARFMFTKMRSKWQVEQTLSKPSDMRDEILVEAFPEKKHGVEHRTYKATLAPTRDEILAVGQIDDLNEFLAELDEDTELSEAVDAQRIKRRLLKMEKELHDGNSMVGGFANYMKAFIAHCDELWAWQVQRLKLDSHAEFIMRKLADKL